MMNCYTHYSEPKLFSFQPHIKYFAEILPTWALDPWFTSNMLNYKVFLLEISVLLAL